MSDTTDIDKSQPASEQLDLSVGMDVDLEFDDIEDLTHDLERVEDVDPAAMDDEELAEIVAGLKALEDAADAACDEFEDELEERVDVGESVGQLSRQRGRNTWVDDEEGAFAAVVEVGGDPMDVATVSISALREVEGVDAEKWIREHEYTHFRRQG